MEEKAKLYEKMTKGDFIGKYNNLFILFYFLKFLQTCSILLFVRITKNGKEI